MSQMADNGFEKAGSLLLGHADLTTSLTHYDHAQIDRLSRVAEKLAEIDPPTVA
jgi:integrase